jgi:hypothetical protein
MYSRSDSHLISLLRYSSTKAVSVSHGEDRRIAWRTSAFELRRHGYRSSLSLGRPGEMDAKLQEYPQISRIFVPDSDERWDALWHKMRRAWKNLENLPTNTTLLLFVFHYIITSKSNRLGFGSKRSLKYAPMSFANWKICLLSVHVDGSSPPQKPKSGMNVCLESSASEMDWFSEYETGDGTGQCHSTLTSVTDSNLHLYHLWNSENQETFVVSSLSQRPEFACTSHTWGCRRLPFSVPVAGVPSDAALNNMYDVAHLSRTPANLGVQCFYFRLVQLEI